MDNIELKAAYWNGYDDGIAAKPCKIRAWHSDAVNAAYARGHAKGVSDRRERS